ncbi:MAG: tetratricopeptide repeat protein [Calditrichaeota bacterium]|nr:MAG: tetratricopeptide repeat protein [Calditrichota bacterium]
MLTYLALHCDAEITRQRIAFLFWPDSEESQARTNLRQLLHHLRQAFPDIERYLTIDKRTIRWRREAPLHIDVAEFLRCIGEAKAAAEKKDTNAELKALEKAARLYRADLLPECYDEWIETERDRLRNLFISVLKRLMELFEEQGQYSSALQCGTRLLSLDEFDETTYRTLMRLHALNNDIPAASQIYHRCVEVLRDELGVEPGTETQSLFQRLTRQEEIEVSPPSMENEIPLVGREEERRTMLQAWEEVTKGNTRILLLCGEAGIGKTRLAEELIHYIERQGYTSAISRCYAAGGRLSYGPVSEWLRTESLYRGLLGMETVWKTEVSRLLPELLTDCPDLIAPAPLTESWQRKRLFEALAHALTTNHEPLLLFIDDLQWCDQETLEWLHFLLHVENLPGVLIMATVRTEDVPANTPLLSFILELRRGNLLTEIELAAIDPEHTASLAAHISGKNLDEKTTKALYASSEGNPLFIVEMTRAVMDDWDRGDKGEKDLLQDIPLPQRVQAVIQSRLAHLTPGSKKLLELAAIIGREFTFDILRYSCEEEEETIIQSLEELLEHRLVREQTRMVYDFSHDKIREVTAAGISQTRSCLIHRRVAEALEQLFAERLDPVAAQLAVHWENGGNPERAIHFYEQSGKLAQQIYANEEAVELLTRALRLVNENLVGREKEKLELNLLRLLSPCLVQARGYGATEVQEIGAQLWKLSRQLEAKTGSPLLRTLAISNLVGGKINPAEQFGIQLLKQAGETHDGVAEVEAHYVLGVTYHWQGHFIKARKHLEKAISLYSPENHAIHITAYAQDPGIICRIRLALVLWHLGYPLRSQTLGMEALEMAERLGHPFSRAYALHWFAWLQNLRNQKEATLEHARASIAFSEEYQFPYFATQSEILYGWALFKLGETENGFQKMREGLSRFRATGSEIGCAYYRGLIAGTLAESGSTQQSLLLLEEALKSMEISGEKWSKSAVLRIQGEVFLNHSKRNMPQAEAAFTEAISVAKVQKAYMDALIAALHLQQMWANSEREKESQEIFQELFRETTRKAGVKEREELRELLNHWTER